MRSLKPDAIPTAPVDYPRWARSTKRPGGMFHAHFLGSTSCGSIKLERHQSEPAETLFDFQYYGVCEKCFRDGGGVKGVNQ